MTENEKYAADQLAGYALTCRMTNTLEWMEGLSMKLNSYLESVQDGDRVTTAGHGLQTITVEERSTLDKSGYPKS